MRPGKTVSYGALIEPQGIHLIEYSRDKGGIHVLAQRRISGSVANVDEAAVRLRSAVDSNGKGVGGGGGGGGGGQASVVIRGFGSAHHIMALPPAKPEVLRPIITRELNRIFVGLSDPVVEFTHGGEYDRRQLPRADTGTPQKELLVAAAPQSLIDAFITENKELDAVTHLTVLPQVMRRLYEHLDNSEEPTAMVLALPGGPEFGFFFEGELRLIIEAPVPAAKPWASKLGIDSDETEKNAINIQLLVDRIGRGSMYLRQQFRGAAVTRVLLACEPEDQERIKQSLENDLGIEIISFAQDIGAPAAIAALGAVIDSENEPGLNLLASYSKPKRNTEQVSKTMLLVSAAILGLIGIVWALGAVVSTTRWAKSVEQQHRSLERQAPGFQNIKAIVDQRAATVQGRAYLSSILDKRDKLRGALRTVAVSTPAGIQLDQISLASTTPGGEGWSGNITGTSSGMNAAQAVEGVDIFYRDLQRHLAGHALTLDALEYVAGAEGDTDTHINFKISFVYDGSAPAAINPVTPADAGVTQ